MSAEIPTVDTLSITGPKRWLREAENSLVVVALAAMTVLPLLEILLRKVAHTGISNVGAIVQHLTLCVGVFGGALAARDQRLLSLSPISQWLKGRWKIVASVLSQGWAATICIFLCAASVEFLISQKGLGQELAYGIQKWWVQLVMPVGFAAVAIRLIWHAGETFPARLLTLAVALTIAGVARTMGARQSAGRAATGAAAGRAEPQRRGDRICGLDA